MATIALGPAAADITGVRAGDKNEYQVALTLNGEPIDLTGLMISAQARSKPTADDFISAVIDVLDAPNGLLMMAWPGDAVRDWLGTNPKKTGVWDMQLLNGTSDATTVVAGAFSAVMDVTR